MTCVAHMATQTTEARRRVAIAPPAAPLPAGRGTTVHASGAGAVGRRQGPLQGTPSQARAAPEAHASTAIARRGGRAAARLQARVRGHQSRLGSTTPFVAPVKEFDVPLGAGTPNQRGAFETRRRAVDDAASVAKVDATLSDVGATPKEDGASIIATADGRSPQVEHVDVVALQMARTRGPPARPSGRRGST